MFMRSTYAYAIKNITDLLFLARRDDCPESYCHDPGVGVDVTPQEKTLTWAISFEL
jgi:hypothetical protein